MSKQYSPTQQLAILNVVIFDLFLIPYSILCLHDLFMKERINGQRKCNNKSLDQQLDLNLAICHMCLIQSLILCFHDLVSFDCNVSEWKKSHRSIKSLKTKSRSPLAKPDHGSIRNGISSGRQTAKTASGNLAVSGVDCGDSCSENRQGQVAQVFPLR